MRSMNSAVFRGREGQSLLEAALFLPVLLLLTFNAVNMGYVFFAYLNMATASRQGAEYSIQGVQTVPTNNLPGPDQVKSLVLDGLSTSIPGGSTAPLRLCTAGGGNGVQNPGTINQVPVCTSYGSGTFTTIQPDPEAPTLVLNRVDVQYTVTPLIDGAAFNLIVP